MISEITWGTAQNLILIVILIFGATGWIIYATRNKNKHNEMGGFEDKDDTHQRRDDDIL